MENLEGIERRNAEKSVIKLNLLLADYELFYDDLKSLPLNIKETELLDLHEKFEECYNDIFAKIDTIAERILTIECKPLNTYANYLKTLRCKEQKKSLMELRLLELS